MEFQFPEYTKRINSLVQRANEVLSTVGQCFSLEEGTHAALKLVFAGQYSAGKSTIIKMLTGRKDIAIGAGITTQQTHIYEWNGLEVIDTPGIHTVLRPDHDEISYKAIADADMLVFVITNELFNSYIAEHFRKLAIDKDKAGEMILVVNKMERASEGNSPEQQEIIREDLRQVLAPYSPEQLNLCFLDAESYLDSMTERENDPELADELLERSGYQAFIETLNDFVTKKGLASTLTTRLYLLVEQLQNTIQKIDPQNEDEDIAAVEEHYLQQRHILVSTRAQLQKEVGALYTTAISKIRETGLDAANLLIEGCNQEEVERQLSDMIQRVEQFTSECQSEAEELVDARLTELGQHLEENRRTVFSQKLEARLTEKMDTMPENLKHILLQVGPGLQKSAQAVVGNAYKAGVTGGLKLSNFSGSAVHDMVLGIGHSLGYKFKPWQAIKWTKRVAIGGQVFNVLGVGLSVFMQMKSDQDEEKLRVELQRNRQNIRSQFNGTADDFLAYEKKFIQECIDYPLTEVIGGIDDHLRQIRATRKQQNDTVRNLESIQNDCQMLIQSIHKNYG